MLFICRDKNRYISVDPPRTEVHHTASGIIEEIIPGKAIKFTVFRGEDAFPNVLPVKFGITHPGGEFRSERAKFRPGLTQLEAEQFLAAHEDYGMEFIAIGKKGEVLGSGDWDDPKKRSEGYLAPSGSGMFCALCQRQLPMRGLNTHLKSKKHVALLVKAEEEGLPEVVTGE